MSDTLEMFPGTEYGTPRAPLEKLRARVEDLEEQLDRADLEVRKAANRLADPAEPREPAKRALLKTTRRHDTLTRKLERAVAALLLSEMEKLP